MTTLHDLLMNSEIDMSMTKEMDKMFGSKSKMRTLKRSTTRRIIKRKTKSKRPSRHVKKQKHKKQTPKRSKSQKRHKSIRKLMSPSVLKKRLTAIAHRYGY